LNELIYSRINLSKTNYELLPNAKMLDSPPIDNLNQIYKDYCVYKQFKSVMPIFDSDYNACDVIGYFDSDRLVAFSLIHLFDDEHAESLQFAWDYKNPKLRLGYASLQHECRYYKDKGYKFLYLGLADKYKEKLDGFEILGPLL